MALQALLLDSVDLFTQVKQAGWNVKGPSFIALHGLFGTLAERVEAHSDTLAERIAALGVEVHGTARAAALRSRLARLSRRDCRRSQPRGRARRADGDVHERTPDRDRRRRRTG